MKQKIQRTFVTGLLISLPLLITVGVIQFIFSRIERVVSPIVLEGIRLLGMGHWLEVAWVEFFAPLLSVTLGMLAIYLVGLSGGNVLGRQVLKNLERLVLQVPVARSIYSATRQFLDTLAQAGQRSFSRVVLVQYPRPGLWTLGLVTNTAATSVQACTSHPLLSIFLPTTPNPTSGWLVFVPEEDVTDVDMSVDDAFKLIISGGVLNPLSASIQPESVFNRSPNLSSNLSSNLSYRSRGLEHPHPPC